MKQKTFDAVEMMHEGQRIASEALAGMTLDEKLAFWASRTEQLRRKSEEARRSGSTWPSIPGEDIPSVAKSFDAVEMMREGQRHVEALLEGMSLEEQIAFWEEQNEAMARRLAAAREALGHDSPD